MFYWARRRIADRGAPLNVAPPPEWSARDGTGHYRQLREYLQDRNADRVVLTFAEIEDLLGFALPDQARAEVNWWGDADQGSSQSEAWTFAGRTATVNLLARSVVFERDAVLDLHSGRRSS
jgi:hypothetical protein